MNSGSSRSHAMLQVLVTQVQRDTLTTRRSKLSESLSSNALDVWSLYT
jgi:hypothetical protein